MTDSPAKNLIASPRPTLHVAAAPHIVVGGRSTRRMMVDVLIGIAPMAGAAIYYFHWLAVLQLAVCVGACIAAEAIFTRMRGRASSLGDASAIVTGLVLALSLPASAPWYVGLIGSVAAIGVGKMVFGGLGQNIFNPAMVGRAFVMISFASAMGAGGYVLPGGDGVITQATPMTMARQGQVVTDIWTLLTAGHNGSLSEVSVLACVIGGVWLCVRRVASWEIPLGVVLGACAVAVTGLLISADWDWQSVLGVSVPLPDLMHAPLKYNLAHHLLRGALLFGAFFVATDPVTSPLTPRGKFVFGLGVGVLVLLMRLFSSWPEGVMFAVLIMNSTTPLINRWTIPTPVGGAGA